MDWFLYDNGLRHERFKEIISITVIFTFPSGSLEYRMANLFENYSI